MKKSVSVILSLSLFLTVFNASVSANSYSNNDMTPVGEEISLESKYKKDLEMVKSKMKESESSQLNSESDEKQHQEFIRAFEEYVSKKLKEDGVSKTSTDVADYKVQYIEEFIKYAYENGIIETKESTDIGLYYTDQEIIDAHRLSWDAQSWIMTGIGLKYTAILLRHSLDNNPPALNYQAGTEISNTIKNSSAYQTKLSSFRAALNNINGNYYSIDSSFALTRSNSSLDMYLALHNVSYLMAAEKVNGSWKIYTWVQDTYNFEEWKYPGISDIPKTLVTFINNTAAESQRIGAIVPYPVNIYIQH